MLAGNVQVDSTYKIRCVLRLWTSEEPQTQSVRDEVCDLLPQELDTKLQSREIAAKDIVDWDLDEEVRLWWPTGYGPQSLYDVDIILLSLVSRPTLI